MSRIHMKERELMLAKLTRQLDGGTLELFDGPMPSDPKYKPKGHLIDVWYFGNPAFRVVNGEAVSTEIDRATDMFLNFATWARALTPNGKTIFDVSRDEISAQHPVLRIRLA